MLTSHTTANHLSTNKRSFKIKSKSNQKPIYIEFYDHKTEPSKTKNIAAENPKLAKELMTQFNKSWKGNLPKG